MEYEWKTWTWNERNENNEWFNEESVFKEQTNNEHNFQLKAETRHLKGTHTHTPSLTNCTHFPAHNSVSILNCSWSHVHFKVFVNTHTHLLTHILAFGNWCNCTFLHDEVMRFHNQQTRFLLLPLLMSQSASHWPAFCTLYFCFNSVHWVRTHTHRRLSGIQITIRFHWDNTNFGYFITIAFNHKSVLVYFHSFFLSNVIPASFRLENNQQQQAALNEEMNHFVWNHVDWKWHGRIVCPANTHWIIVSAVTISNRRKIFHMGIFTNGTSRIRFLWISL